MRNNLYDRITSDVAYNARSGREKPVSELLPGSNYLVRFSCPICEKERHVPFSKLSQTTFTGLCSKCLNIPRRKTLKPGARYGRLTVLGAAGVNMSLVECDCGVRQEVVNWTLTGGRKRSCGCLRKETFKTKAEQFVGRGENHPNWKGGVSGKRYAEMARKDYREWRAAVYERDEYACQACGSSCKRLEAHHLNPYHSTPKERVSIDNGVTLCVDCHRLFHQTHSYTDFNAEDYLRFADNQVHLSMET